MIRIYLDWNIYSYFKDGVLDEFKAMIESLSEVAIIPYSPAHFTDLMKSYTPSNDKFYKDIQTLQDITSDYHIQWDTEQRITRPFKINPYSYFEDIKDLQDIDLLDNLFELSFYDDDEFTPLVNNAMQNLKSMAESLPIGFEITNEIKPIIEKMYPDISNDSSMLDFFKSFSEYTKRLISDREEYLYLRDINKQCGIYLDMNAGNWSIEEVIDRVSNHVKDKGLAESFESYVSKTLELRNEENTLYNFYVAAYMMLDMLGYKADKIGRDGSIMNVVADAQHSFYGAHCDFFVATDKRLRLKSKALYKHWNINTKVFSPDEFIANFNKCLKPCNDLSDLIKTSASYIPAAKRNNPIPWYLSYFNYVQTDIYENPNEVSILFYRDKGNYSRYYYYAEFEHLITQISMLLGGDTDEVIKRFRTECIGRENKSQDFTIHWKMVDYLNIRLEFQENGTRPILIFDYDLSLLPKKMKVSNNELYTTV